MTFMYDDKAQVTCTEKTVEALAGKSGAILKVTYREEGGERIATRIEGAALSPSARSGPRPLEIVVHTLSVCDADRISATIITRFFAIPFSWFFASAFLTEGSEGWCATKGQS